MKHSVRLVALVLLLALSSGLSRAQEVKGFRADLLGQIAYAQKEIMELENAIPEDKMAWRPNKDVRSISEVYLHIAGSNYYLGKFAGIAPPADLKMDQESDGDKVGGSTTDKKVIAEKLQASFAHLTDGIKKLSDDKLDDPVTMFGMKMTVRGVLMTVATHMHEHLGQSIAYARSVGVVPPWTARQMAAQKEKKG